MGIYELVDLANAGNAQPMWNWLNANKQRAEEMEFELEVHHTIAPMGQPKYYHTQCEGRFHSHPDTARADCLPYVHYDGLTIHMLCSRCACANDPLGLQD